jgi:hypothetical protein
MDRLGDVLNMFKNLSFLNPKQFRDLSQIKTVRLQGVGNLLPQG